LKNLLGLVQNEGVNPVEVVVKDKNLSIFDHPTGELIVSHILSDSKGELIRIVHPEKDTKSALNKVYDTVLTALGGSSNAKLFLENIHRDKSRYFKDQLGLIMKTCKNLNTEAISTALEYCVKKELWSAVYFKDVVHYSLMKKSSNTKTENPSLPNSYKSKTVRPEIRYIDEYTKALGGE